MIDFGSFQSLKTKLDNLLATTVGRLAFMFAVAFTVALLVFALIIYAFLRPPAKKTVSPLNQLSTSNVTGQPIPTELIQTIDQAELRVVLAAIESNNKLLEANDLRGFYDNLAASLKQNVSFETFTSLLVARLGSDFVIISARRATDPVFANNTAQVNITITYQVGVNIKQITNTFYYLKEGNSWKLNLIR